MNVFCDCEVVVVVVVEAEPEEVEGSPFSFNFFSLLKYRSEANSVMCRGSMAS